MTDSTLKICIRGYKGKMPSYYIKLDMEIERKREPRSEVRKRGIWKKKESKKKNNKGWGKGEAISSKKPREKRSIADRLLELGEFKEVTKQYELSLIEEKMKQSEQLKALGKVWEANTKGREDEVQKVLNQILNENKEEAMAKL